MDKITIKELQNHFPNPITWDNVTVSMEDILNRIDKVKEIIEPFPFQWDIKRIEDEKLYTKDWHIGRIKYFINNPDKIELLELIFEKDKIRFYDGCHRFLAHVIRNDKECCYKKHLV